MTAKISQQRIVFADIMNWRPFDGLGLLRVLHWVDSFFIFIIHSAYWNLEWQKTSMQKLQIKLLNANTFFLNWVVGSRILSAQLGNMVEFL